ncbi:MAG: hypothetical protein KDC93_13480 [Cyclobacteriaceae bacterium]|nr:hypothetical protein [Cyclobacteriaceae bacterium]
MKIKFILALQLLSLSLFAQTLVNKSVAIKKGQTILMKFDYPELIRVSTWDKNDISIQANVSINNGENDDAFELSINNTVNSVTVENRIADIKNLPQMITVRDGAERIVFRSKEEYKKFKAENGRSFDRVSWGVDIDVIIDIKVPKGIDTNIISTYGMVEVSDFEGPLMVEAQYGGVDVALNEKKVGELSAETNYGQIYSNLDVPFSGKGLQEKDFYTFVSAKPGSGPRYDFESKYGNVYLRKRN